MINFNPLFTTLKKREISTYKLIYHYNISSSIIRRLKKNQPVNSTTINYLCLVLKCNIWDIMEFSSTEEEIKQVEEIRKETIARYSHPRKKKLTE